MIRVEQTEKEIHSYTLSLEIEREGETYSVSVYYDTHEGHEVYFLGSRGERIPTPEWATNLEEELTCPLGFWLEEQIEEVNA